MFVESMPENPCGDTGPMGSHQVPEGWVEEHGPKRKLTTILCADCAGYSRMMRADEEGTYRVLQDCRQLIARLIGEHEGRIFGSAGDSVVAEFPSPVEAVRAATEIQQAIAALAASLPEDHRMQFRIGINVGDVMIAGDDLIGDGVNVAARLQGLAEPGGICISGSVHEQIRNKLALAWDDLGDQAVKNIAEPVHAFRVQVGIRGTYRSQAPSIATPRRLRLAGVGLLAVLALGSLIAYFMWPNPSPQCSQASIAVLPFANLSGDPTQQYFSDGTTEDIIAALGRFSDLAVTAHVAVQRYKEKSVLPDEVSRELGVCYILTGSIRKNGDQVLVTAELTDARIAQHLDSYSYGGDLKDIFDVRNQLTLSVVGKLAIKIEDLERQRALKKPTDNLDAYDLVLRGRDAYARNTRSANNDARKLFEQAIQLDPTYASAYAALGKTRATAAFSGWTEFPDDAYQQAERLAQKSIELDKDNAEAHRLLGDVYSYRRQFDLAIREMGRAIELNPSDAEGYLYRGGLLVTLGRSGEAIADFETAKSLNPGLGSASLQSIGWAYYLQHRYQDAATTFAEGAHAAPNDYFNHAGLAASYGQLGRKEEGAQAAADVLRTWPFFRVDKFITNFQDETDRALIAEGLRKAGLE
jgi:class 3 adenylate cyclase/TolB-like protein/Flp pilus assembly protein TadD